MNRLLFLLLTCTAFASTGCVMAADEGCTSDSQCYGDRACVDGRCTGEVPLNMNNSVNNENNSFNNENNSFNNENNFANNENNSFNNENNFANNENNFANNENNFANNENNFANNENNGQLCMRGADCGDGRVCTSFEPGNDEWQCVEPWRCDANYELTDAVCFADFFCAIDNGARFRQLICEFGDEDNGYCFCFSEPDDVTYEFEASRDFCDAEGLIDLANTRCGWRVSDGTF